MVRLLRFSLVFSFTIAVFLALTTGMASAQGEVGLVIALGNGQIETQCIAVTEPGTTGYELLEQSGLDIAVDAQGMGVAVCSIEGVGCPANDCFCACKGGGECNYWSYWTHENDAWRYSPNGAGREQVAAGDVQGWSWGPGAVNSAEAPPAISFDAICPADTAQAVTVTPTMPKSTVDWKSFASFAVIMAVVGGSWLLLTYVRRQPT
ncbi:MAG: hypothetical protein M9928_12235 [Anaerolineae bacterium]|nr:hypothetical protein [Anaerolineae bacterium]MCO5205797.1 hypothetical protein [Anaerolineae bacterium]